MNFRDLKPGVELGNDLLPKEWSEDLVHKRVAPFAVGITCFFIGVTVVMHGFRIWPHSPFLYAVGFCSAIVMSIIMLFLGLVVLLITASLHVLKNMPELYKVSSFQVLSATVLSGFLAYCSFRVIRRSEISVPTLRTVVTVCAFVLLLLLIPGYVIEWLKGISGLVAQLVASK